MGGTRYGWLAVLVLFAVAPAGAQERRGKEPPTLEEQARENERITKQTIALHSSMSDFVGALRLSDRDARLVIVHYPSFADLYRKGEKPLEVRVRQGFEKDGRYDFSLVVDAPEFLSWAEQKKLDGKAWLRSAFRAILLSTRADLSEGLEEYRRQIAMLEKMAGDAVDADLDRAIAELKWILDLSQKTIAVIPAPTDDENEVLAKHRAALEQAMSTAAPPAGEAEVPKAKER